jgi:hypothetical protein
MERKRKYRRLIKYAGLILLCCIVLWAAAMLYNNVSMQNNKAFSASLDKSISEAAAWISERESAILNTPNVALLKMLDECDKMHPTPEFSGMVKKFMLKGARPKCWKALIDPNWPVDKIELNETIKREYIDNKWILYALSPQQADVTPEQLGLFNYDAWNGRQLTHQLWGLIRLREQAADKTKLDKLIEHLCRRLTNELYFNAAVVDIYIQKNAFVLRAGYPQKIHRRWIERVIENQRSDGGWNDKWFIFTSSRKPTLEQMQSDPHATIQAIWLLYQAKYKYPEYFGLADRKNSSSTKLK